MGTKCTRLLHELKAHYEFMTVCLTMSDEVARVEVQPPIHTHTHTHTHTRSVILHSSTVHTETQMQRTA